jgi:hypothetical protein
MTRTSPTVSIPGFWKSFWKALSSSGWFEWKEKPSEVSASKSAPRRAEVPKVEEKKPVT